MDKFSGIGPNFDEIKRKDFYGQRVKNDAPQEIAQKAVDFGNKHIEHKNPDDMLNAMHLYGANNLVAPKINAPKASPEMKARIADFMSEFEVEVEKGLEVFKQDFPSVDEAEARAISAEAILNAIEMQF